MTSLPPWSLGSAAVAATECHHWPKDEVMHSGTATATVAQPVGAVAGVEFPAADAAAAAGAEDFPDADAADEVYPAAAAAAEENLAVSSSSASAVSASGRTTPRR